MAVESQMNDSNQSKPNRQFQHGWNLSEPSRLEASDTYVEIAAEMMESVG